MRLTHLALIATLMAAAGAQAQAPTSSEGDRAVARACKADAKTLCAGKTGQEAMECLKSNQAKLSTNCKDAMSKMPQK